MLLMVLGKNPPDRRNEFDAFSVKTIRAVDNATVGHLTREISRPTKYLLDQGTTVKAVTTCSYYRRSGELFEGDLEIPCSVTVSLPGTIPNHLLLDRYRELVTELYCEPKDEIIIGNFQTPTEQGHKNDRKGFQYQKRKRFSAKTSGFCLDARKRTTRTKIKTKK